MYSEYVLSGILLSLWIFLTLGAIARGLVNIAGGNHTGAKKFFLGVAFLMALVLANAIGLALAFVFGYCENCAGKPLGLRDVVIFLAVITPSAIALFLCILKS